MTDSTSLQNTPDTWEAVNRGLEFEGEERANLLRILAVGAFYGVQLVTHYSAARDSDALAPSAVSSPEFHVRVTFLAAVWILLALGLFLALRNRIFPPALKYVSTAADLLLLTSVLLVADGPRSPMVVGFFVIVALSALRFRQRLVWCATLGAIGLYLAINVQATHFSTRAIAIPAYQQAFLIVGLLLEGVILGEVVRKVRRTSELFAIRRAAAAGEESR